MNFISSREIKHLMGMQAVFIGHLITRLMMARWLLAENAVAAETAFAGSLFC